jgi:organic hydroperoxide reductase OsmC/OhrA
MTSVSITEYETRLFWQGERGAVLTSDQAPPVPIGRPLAEPATADEGRWAPESLLVGAVEGRTLLAFLDRAREAHVPVLFYQSSAMARMVAVPGRPPQFTDLIVRPHVAVPTDADAETARLIFSDLPEHCFPSSILQLTPRIEPVVETWHVRADAGRDTQADASASPPAT